MNDHEEHYSIHDLELATIHALNMCRHYLLDRRFVLMSDHIGFRYIFEKPNLNANRLDGWPQSMSLISRSGTSKLRRIGWHMISVGGYK